MPGLSPFERWVLGLGQKPHERDQRQETENAGERDAEHRGGNEVNADFPENVRCGKPQYGHQGQPDVSPVPGSVALALVGDPAQPKTTRKIPAQT